MKTYSDIIEHLFDRKMSICLPRFSKGGMEKREQNYVFIEYSYQEINGWFFRILVQIWEIEKWFTVEAISSPNSAIPGMTPWKQLRAAENGSKLFGKPLRVRIGKLIDGHDKIWGRTKVQTYDRSKNLKQQLIKRHRQGLQRLDKLIEAVAQTSKTDQMIEQRVQRSSELGAVPDKYRLESEVHEACEMAMVHGLQLFQKVAKENHFELHL